MREICTEGGVFLFYIKSLGGVYNTQTKLNPGAALEEPEQQGIRSIKENTTLVESYEAVLILAQRN